MRKPHTILGILSLILILAGGCKKEVADILSLEFKLIDVFGAQKSIFSETDSLIFEFYLTNHTGEVATYLRPCGEFGNYLRIYRETSDGNYVYYGRPEYFCADVAIYDEIGIDETIRIGRMPWSVIHGWPEKMLGKYYVGDTLALQINGTIHKFVKRIDFGIE